MQLLKELEQNVSLLQILKGTIYLVWPGILKVTRDREKICPFSPFLRCRHCRLEKHTFKVRHKQDWGLGFILILPHATVLARADVGVDVSASGFVIQNRQTSCSVRCPYVWGMGHIEAHY